MNNLPQKDCLHLPPRVVWHPVTPSAGNKGALQRPQQWSYSVRGEVQQQLEKNEPLSEHSLVKAHD